MSKISAVDFANSVEANRKKLIRHCVENGKEVSSTASLDTVVGVTNTINETQPEGTYKVEFKDIDGSLFAPVQYVQAGGDATIPSETPSFDSEYLEFVEWKTSASDPLTNVQRDILALPFYRTKYDEALGQRPTYLICYFDSTTLSPTLRFKTYTNTYILWGDGSAAEKITGTTISHTYANPGIYTITIYGDAYCTTGGSAIGLFTSSTYAYALLRAYMGENVKITGLNEYQFAGNRSLTTFVPIEHPNEWQQYNFTGAYCFYQCLSLNNVIAFPPNIGSNTFAGCLSLSNIIMTQGCTIGQQNVFSTCYSLKSLILPETTSSKNSFAYNGVFSNSNLEKINIPSGVLTIEQTVFAGTKLTKLDLTGVTTIRDRAFSGCTVLKEVLIPDVTSLGASVFENTQIEYLTIPSSIATMTDYTLSGMYSLKEIVLPQDFDLAINMYTSMLSHNCLVDIANKLKDNSGGLAKRITFKTGLKGQLNSIYLDSNGGEVAYGTIGAVNLLEFITNKNWTVAFN